MVKEELTRSDKTQAEAERQDYLQQWFDKAQGERERARQALVVAQKAFAEAEQRVNSLESLLALEGGTGPTGQSTHKNDVIAAAVTILREEGGPLRIGEIRTRLLEDGVPLPGKGNDANLIALFQRSHGQIVRVARGLYNAAQKQPALRLIMDDGRIILLGASTTIGRADSNDVILSDKTVGLQHARIDCGDDGEVELSVLDPQAPLTINGAAPEGPEEPEGPEGPVVLHAGDRIVIGATPFTVHFS